MFGMSFKMKKLNHTPDWYAEHCRDENASPSVRAMLKRDMEFIGADNQNGMVDTERIEVYRERWDVIMKDGEVLREHGGGVFRSDIVKKEMMIVVERESLNGFRASDQFKDEPFKTIDELMTQAGINENMMRGFLKWRSRRGPVAKKEEIPIQEPASKIAARKVLRQLARRSNPFIE